MYVFCLCLALLPVPSLSDHGLWFDSLEGLREGTVACRSSYRRVCVFALAAALFVLRRQGGDGVVVAVDVASPATVNLVLLFWIVLDEVPGA